MLSVDEAIRRIVDAVERRAAVSLRLDEARDLVLAEDIVSDVDSPPFDKSQMDGFAIRAADVPASSATLQILETLTAGQTPQQVVSPGQATRIMTGAPIPSGADAVIPIERCEIDKGDMNKAAARVLVKGAVEAGMFIVRQGASMANGETVLKVGTILLPPQLGLLAELGRAAINVFPRPTVGILATGDELVPVETPPGPGQIRNSNQTMLSAQIARMGGRPVPLEIARDDRQSLQQKIAAGLECDILCLSGGVSMGTLDLVPAELQAAGVQEVFHKVAMKPGKPVWFGKLEATAAPDGRPRWIFGLPGNPVSSMVCCELFVRTALRQVMGQGPVEPQAGEAKLEVEHAARGDRPTYFPARLSWTADGRVVRPVDWRGSFDLRATAEANSMILFPAGTRTYNAGEQVLVYEW